MKKKKAPLKPEEKQEIRVLLKELSIFLSQEDKEDLQKRFNVKPETLRHILSGRRFNQKLAELCALKIYGNLYDSHERLKQLQKLL